MFYGLSDKVQCIPPDKWVEPEGLIAAKIWHGPFCGPWVSETIRHDEHEEQDPNQP